MAKQDHGYRLGKGLIYKSAMANNSRRHMYEKRFIHKKLIAI